MVVGALELREEIAERLFEFVLAVGADDKRSVHCLAKTLDRIGRARAKHFCVRFHGQELGQGEVLLVKAEPADGLSQVTILNLVLGMTRQLHGRRPAFFDAEFRQKGAPAWLEDAPQLCDESEGT